MLEIVKDYIDSMEDITFPQYYTAYLIEVQDRNLDYEFRHLLSRNTLTVSVVDTMVTDMLERLRRENNQ